MSATSVRRSEGILVGTLSIVVLTVAILQTAVVPILTVIATQVGASAVNVSWVLTANLLAAAASTPLIGRLADLRSKKRVLLAVLGLVLAGSVLAAVTSSLALLVLARVLQGASFSLYPVSVAVLRDEVPAELLVRSMAVLSAMLGLGGGLGLVVTGLLMKGNADYHRVFWLTTAFSVAITIAVAVVVPRRDNQSTGSIDWAGALGLALGLSALLLALTESGRWGGDSVKTIGLAAAGLGIMAGWWRWERRCLFLGSQPLVSVGMLARRPILLTNIATVLVGMGLYFVFLGLTDFVETPTASGYGFGASVLDASMVFLLPGAIAASVTAVVSGRYIERFGARVVGMTGAAAGVLGFLLLATLHTSRWEVIAAYLLANAYISLAYGALPVLVVGEVDARETAVATSMNAIARTVGSAIGAALVAVILSPKAKCANGFIAEHDYVILFALGGLSAVAAVLFIAATPRRV
ncbi:MAG TPA: MFS transporter [Mycobacterium sp.]|nr:MFS transporter [Mycobacterium sp.]HQC76744.1 MFS transporter [Mycobacterium sp.]